MDRLEVRISITKVLLALIVVIVPLSIVGLVLAGRSDSSLDNAIGNDFKALAQTYSVDVSEYIRDRVADVNAIAADSSVIAAFSGAAAETGLKRAGNSSASAVLRQRRNLDPRYLSIAATDPSGVVVATTQQTGKQSYAEDQNWQNAYNNGQGAVQISEVLDDEVTKASYVDIDVPIGDPNTGHLAGVLSAGSQYFASIGAFSAKSDWQRRPRAMLVDESGIIVSGPNADVFAHVKSPEFAAIQDSLGSLQGSQSGWRLAGLGNGPAIVGFSATGLKQHFSTLGWAVLVSEPEHDAAA